MDVTAIICEYNPFHNGHKIQIEYIRKNYPDTVIVAIMSGNTTQRGEFAVLEKYDRAEIALKGGVDVVLELPYPWCCASAGYFALGGVSTAKKIGADRICFGSECGDIALLKNAAKRLSCREFEEKLKLELGLNPGCAYMSVRSELYKKLYGEQIPEGANNLLGIEYISKAEETGYKGGFITCKREARFSATECRNAIKNGDRESLYEMLPCDFECNFSEQKNADSLFLWNIGNAEATELEGYCDIDGTLASSMKANAEKATTLSEYLSLCTNKKYPRARIARATMNAILKTTEKHLKSEPLFTVLLGCNGNGRRFLSHNRGNGDIALITKNADYKNYSPKIREQFEFSLKSDKLYSVLHNLEREYVMKKSPVITK